MHSPGREEKETCQVREYCHPRWKTAWFEQWMMVMWMLINTKGAWGRWNQAHQMKRRIEKEYFCQVQRIFKSKMNGGKMVQEISCRVVAVVWYVAGIVEWTKILELQIVDRKMRNLCHSCICRLISTGFTLKDQWVVEDLWMLMTL